MATHLLKVPFVLALLLLIEASPTQKRQIPDGSINEIDDILPTPVFLEKLDIPPGAVNYALQGDEIIKNAQNPHLVEGDIMLTEEQYKQRMSGNSKRNAIANMNRRWTRRQVYYHIPRDIFNSFEVTVIKQAAEEIKETTCLRFHDLDSDFMDKVIGVPNKIEFDKRDGCWSYLGMQEKNQTISLGTNCVATNVVIHEFAHALGLHHEHNRSDRDKYIKLTNVKPSCLDQFRKLSVDEENTYGVPYDYRSIMHYDAMGCAADRKRPVFTTVDPKYQNIVGHAQHLSFKDMMILNRMYGCGDSCGHVQCPKEGYVDESCTCLCESKWGVGYKFPAMPCY